MSYVGWGSEIHSKPIKSHMCPIPTIVQFYAPWLSLVYLDFIPMGDSSKLLEGISFSYSVLEGLTSQPGTHGDPRIAEAGNKTFSKPPKKCKKSIMHKHTHIYNYIYIYIL
jgi:hypothetical protein